MSAPSHRGDRPSWLGGLILAALGLYGLAWTLVSLVWPVLRALLRAGGL